MITLYCSWEQYQYSYFVFIPSTFPFQYCTFSPSHNAFLSIALICYKYIIVYWLHKCLLGIFSSKAGKETGRAFLLLLEWPVLLVCREAAPLELLCHVLCGTGEPRAH